MMRPATQRETLQQILDDQRRVRECVERHFQRSGQTDWPTVRQVARRCRMLQSDVQQIAEDSDDICLSRCNTEHEPPLGDWYVETM